MALPEIKLGLLQWLPESWHVSIWVTSVGE
jgi:hypothetical protein